MAALTDRKMAKIAKLQREEGVQRLSRHFSWPEFSGDELRHSAHQQFVYDCAMFASARGLAWGAVRSVAGMTRDLFPQLADLDLPRVLSLISDWLTECLPCLPPAQRNAVFHFLSDTCVTRQRLLQTVTSGTCHLTISQEHLEVQVPPTPLPLVQGFDECVWERQCVCARLQIAEQQKREELRRLREEEGPQLGSEFTLDTTKDHRLDRQEVAALVRSTVRARGDLLMGILLKESRLVYELLELSLQQTALTTGGSSTKTHLTHTPPDITQTSDFNGATKTART
ncbi:uncharacterized protein C8orf74 homolog isoform X1 [Esox lucius]|uniref:Uncharacterized protein n=1 Tax=Esox lucius TaxID=8010 RepID=A0A3P8YNL7_ESOLU|nr:uncharacterized protein C8orf74 homolog isoform X1 [Esox lucius]XP_019909355.2 uncharacterized protein C8orf74 homolog isoform X1 [Esox lucius]XP_034153427.1 uncharacterized protein C8orf74 homolog isoform X1 [Esox lucius]